MIQQVKVPVTKPEDLSLVPFHFPDNTKDLPRIFPPTNRFRNTALHEASLLGLEGRESIAILLGYVQRLTPLRIPVTSLLTFSGVRQALPSELLPIVSGKATITQ